MGGWPWTAVHQQSKRDDNLATRNQARRVPSTLPSWPREFLTDSLTTGNTEQMLLIQNSFTEVFASYPKKGVLQCRS